VSCRRRVQKVEQSLVVVEGELYLQFRRAIKVAAIRAAVLRVDHEKRRSGVRVIDVCQKASVQYD